MDKVCYAIMPYGGSEQVMIDRFNTVYQLYMMIPAMEKGFVVTRRISRRSLEALQPISFIIWRNQN